MYRLAVGHRDGAQPGAIVGALTNEGGLTGKDLGKIDIFPGFSLVEIATELDPRRRRPHLPRPGGRQAAAHPPRRGPRPRVRTASPAPPHGPGAGHREHGGADRRPRTHRPAAY